MDSSCACCGFLLRRWCHSLVWHQENRTTDIWVLERCFEGIFPLPPYSETNTQKGKSIFNQNVLKGSKKKEKGKLILGKSKISGAQKSCIFWRGGIAGRALPFAHLVALVQSKICSDFCHLKNIFLLTILSKT